MAERGGFEPPVPFEDSRFPGVRVKPLCHLSNRGDMSHGCPSEASSFAVVHPCPTLRQYNYRNDCHNRENGRSTQENKTNSFDFDPKESIPLCQNAGICGNKRS